jgi:hypothetical protein
LETDGSNWVIFKDCFLYAAAATSLIATVIPDLLFIELRKKEMAYLMWEAVKSQREKKSCMITMDMR